MQFGVMRLFNNSALNVIEQVEDPESQKLTLRLMDDESVEKSEYIGTVALAIKEVIDFLSSSQIPMPSFSLTWH